MQPQVTSGRVGWRRVACRPQLRGGGVVVVGAPAAAAGVRRAAPGPVRGRRGGRLQRRQVPGDLLPAQVPRAHQRGRAYQELRPARQVHCPTLLPLIFLTIAVVFERWRSFSCEGYCSVTIKIVPLRQMVRKFRLGVRQTVCSRNRLSLLNILASSSRSAQPLTGKTKA